MNFTIPTITPGWILALVGLILAVVFWAIGRLDAEIAGLFILGYLARLL